MEIEQRGAHNQIDRVSFQQLRYLLAVVDHPTWADAADDLGVTASALSQGLAELERRTGTALFERLGRQRILRDDARPVVDFARRVVAQHHDFERELDRRRRGAGGELRLGLVDSAALSVLPEAIREFRARHPTVRVLVKVGVSDDLIESLRNARLDLVVVVESPATSASVAAPDLHVEPLVKEAFNVYAPDADSSSSEHAAPTTASWVGYPSGSRTRSLIDAALERRWRHAPRVVAESVNPEVLAQLVQLEIGWGVLPRLTGEQHGLTPWEPKALLLRPLASVWRLDAEWDPRREGFMSLARQRAQAGPGGTRSARRPALRRR